MTINTRRKLTKKQRLLLERSFSTIRNAIWENFENMYFQSSDKFSTIK